MRVRATKWRIPLLVVVKHTNSETYNMSAMDKIKINEVWNRLFFTLIVTLGGHFFGTCPNTGWDTLCRCPLSGLFWFARQRRSAWYFVNTRSRVTSITIAVGKETSTGFHVLWEARCCAWLLWVSSGVVFASEVFRTRRSQLLRTFFFHEIFIIIVTLWPAVHIWNPVHSCFRTYMDCFKQNPLPYNSKQAWQWAVA